MLNLDYIANIDDYGLSIIESRPYRSIFVYSLEIGIKIQTMMSTKPLFSAFIGLQSGIVITRFFLARNK